MKEPLFAIRWQRSDPKKGTVYGHRVTGDMPVPDEPILIDDEQHARDLAAWLNEHTTAYEYAVERVRD